MSSNTILYVDFANRVLISPTEHTLVIKVCVRKKNEIGFISWKIKIYIETIEFSKKQIKNPAAIVYNHTQFISKSSLKFKNLLPLIMIFLAFHLNVCIFQNVQSRKGYASKWNFIVKRGIAALS